MFQCVTRLIFQSRANSLTCKSFERGRALGLLVRLYSAGNKKWPPHVILNMPALSPTMTQGNIGMWKKKIGEGVNPGDVLVEIETDKAQMDYECQEEGFLAKILLPEGTQEVQVGTPMAILSEESTDVNAFEDYFLALKKEEPKTLEAASKAEAELNSEKTRSFPDNQENQPNTSAEGKVKASPLAKSIAKAENIDLTAISGTGPHGRIIKSDLSQVFLKAKPTLESTYLDIPLSNMRKVIASRLTLSKQMLPHYYLTAGIRMDALLKIRERLNKASAESRQSYKLTVNDFIVKAAALALQSVPEVNSAWIDGDQKNQQPFIRQYKNSDICVAVATPTGLVTPIVAAVEDKGLLDISNEIRSLVELAREQKLRPEQYQGGSFTISNLGMVGGVVEQFTAIINPPQSCILAVGQTIKTAVPRTEDGNFETASIMKVTLSCDHRVVDGATGALWLKHFKGFLEEPTTMLL